MLPFVAIIVIAVLTFRSARTYGRNALLWTVAVVVGYYAIQIVMSVSIFVAMAIGAEIWGWSPTLYEDNLFVISFVLLVPSMAYAIIILKLAGREREDYMPTQNSSPLSIASDDQ